jgi:dienelactone hydrolase
MDESGTAFCSCSCSCSWFPGFLSGLSPAAHTTPSLRNALGNASRAGVLALILLAATGLQAAAPWEPIPRRLPPAGIEIPAAERDALTTALKSLDGEFRAWLASTPPLARLAPDVAIYLKAVRYAVDHGEFWEPVETKWAGKLLEVARQRLDALRKDESPWTQSDGLVFRGFESALDGSVQPYGLQIPSGLDRKRPAPLYVYLHGRREKMVELQFLEQAHEIGRIEAPGTYVLHAFGRYCNGYKAAGEVDIREALAHARTQYSIDPDRVALAGFSMGGAGVWHLAAHYPDLWVAASPGAGFAETAQYNKLTPEDFPPDYEQLLWGLYDVPAYVRNLFHMDVIAYTGENDRQIQAAHIMAAAYREHGHTLTHVVGPDTGHKYHPESRLEILRRLKTAVTRGVLRTPEKVSLQTRTLRYDRCRWVRILELEKHWEDSRVDARQHEGRVDIQTRNVAAFEIQARQGTRLGGADATLDRTTTIKLPASSGQSATFRKVGSIWTLDDSPPSGLRKIHGLQGPIDDAFLEPFLVVTPSASASHPRVEAWIQYELSRFLERWRLLFRGEPRVKKDVDVTADDLARYHLILWGDRQSNLVLSSVLTSEQFPIRWNTTSVAVGATKFPASHHVPVLIYPNPLQPSRYVVVNSGMTFREGHDRTNSLQNPKLPDWAVLDISERPTAEAAGRVVLTDFFDERWRLQEAVGNTGR